MTRATDTTPPGKNAADESATGKSATGKSATADTLNWDELARRGPLRSVLDPKDTGEFKNRLIDALQWAALERHLVSPGRLLDFGCGTGRLAARIRDLGIDYAGVDSSEGMVTNARTLNPGLRFEAFDGKALPFPDSHFDISLSCGVFQYLVGQPECQKLLKEIARVLKPGGALLLLEQASLSRQKSGTVSRSSLESDYTHALEEGFGVESVERVRSSKNPELSFLSFRLAKHLPFIFPWFLARLAAARVEEYRKQDDDYYRGLEYYDFLMKARVKKEQGQ